VNEADKWVEIARLGDRDRRLIESMVDQMLDLE
jgi:hypothetical protein